MTTGRLSEQNCQRLKLFFTSRFMRQHVCAPWILAHVGQLTYFFTVAQSANPSGVSTVAIHARHNVISSFAVNVFEACDILGSQLQQQRFLFLSPVVAGWMCFSFVSESETLQQKLINLFCQSVESHEHNLEKLADLFDSAKSRDVCLFCVGLTALSAHWGYNVPQEY